MPAGSEIGESGGRVSQKVPDDDRDGPTDGALGPGPAEAVGQSAEPLAEEGAVSRCCWRPVLSGDSLAATVLISGQSGTPAAPRPQSGWPAHAVLAGSSSHIPRLPSSSHKMEEPPEAAGRLLARQPRVLRGQKPCLP